LTVTVYFTVPDFGDAAGISGAPDIDAAITGVSGPDLGPTTPAVPDLGGVVSAPDLGKSTGISVPDLYKAS
jgi:hypothetical protein